jgi:hypothetical protein
MLFHIVQFSHRRRSLSGAHAGAFAIACAMPAGSASAATVGVDPDILQATVVSVDSEGALCPAGSLGLSISGPTATVIFSQSIGGVQTAGCKLTFELDVPEGLALGMPTTILRGVAVGRTLLERRYAFEGAGAGNAFTELLPEDFIIADRSSQIESSSCQGSTRVRYSVDVTAQIQEESAFFQLNSVDIDTTFRFGTAWRFCDRNQTLEIEPGQSGEFCDGPQSRPCADGLICDRERDPNASEGTCTEP